MADDRGSPMSEGAQPPAYPTGSSRMAGGPPAFPLDAAGRTADPRDEETHPAHRAFGPEAGRAALEIGNSVVQLLHAYAGRGPTKAKTTIANDLVIVHLRECLTVAEQTLSGSGYAQLVEEARDVIHEAIRAEAIAAVTGITGRGVLAYLSSQEVDPDHAIIAFVLEADAE